MPKLIRTVNHYGQIYITENWLGDIHVYSTHPLCLCLLSIVPRSFLKSGQFELTDYPVFSTIHWLLTINLAPVSFCFSGERQWQVWYCLSAAPSLIYTRPCQAAHWLAEGSCWLANQSGPLPCGQAGWLCEVWPVRCWWRWEFQGGLMSSLLLYVT